MLTNDKALIESATYTNFQGLQALTHEYKQKPNAVKEEIAAQFESLLIQMLLKSMRSSNKELSSGLFSSEQADFYHDLYDKQLSLVLAKSGLGLGKSIKSYLDGDPVKPTPAAEVFIESNFKQEPLAKSEPCSTIPSPEATAGQKIEANPSFKSAKDFVTTLWDHAKKAADLIGADPKLLIAQAALETNWGKKIIAQPDGSSSNNLFNIKADKQWDKAAATFTTLEEKNGVLIKEKALFRAYDSLEESLIDYTNFLKNNNRYSQALSKASQPKEFIQSLQEASYATDSTYAEKIMSIYSSEKFNSLFRENKLI